VTVVRGGPEIDRAFSALPFDHVMFTGSPAVGRQVMAAAAANHASVTLELGGKSPTIIAEDCALKRALPSIFTGKLLNGGQTCLAPDYLLVPEARLGELVELARRIVGRMYPRLGDNPDYTSIINDRHYRRLRGYLDDARAKGAQVIEINPSNEPERALGRKIPPTLLFDVTDEMLVMQEEIFGPLLPVKPYRDLRDALDYINDRPRPLAIYVFTNRDEVGERVIAGTMSGGVCINETLLHVAQEDLPFGGVGMSGIGQYHGYEGFLEFSKLRPVFEQSRLSAIPLLRAPYGQLAEAILAALTRR
jgi:acyl-CoA reductase-like NAD-dependent aldehyde dehydrogenase